MSVRLWLILIIAGSAVFMDFLMEKVVNSFICLGWIIGFFYQIFNQGSEGLLIFIKGISIPFFLLLPLFYFRMLGAGDVKLFSVLGGILGGTVILKVMFCSFCLGAVLSLAFLISCGNLKERFSYFFNYFYQYYQTGIVCPYMTKGRQAENFHFTVPVFLGIMLYAGGLY